MNEPNHCRVASLSSCVDATSCGRNSMARSDPAAAAVAKPARRPPAARREEDVLRRQPPAPRQRRRVPMHVARARWCRRRRPVVSKRLVLVLPAEDLRSRQLHISTAELAGCCRARLPRCAPAGTEPPVASAHSSLRDLRVLKAGWVSSRLLFGRSLCGQLLCSRLLCSRLLCSDEAKVRWVGARSLRVRLGCFTNLHRQSTGNAVPRIMWTLELQRWPHIWDACGPAP